MDFKTTISGTGIFAILIIFFFFHYPLTKRSKAAKRILPPQLPGSWPLIGHLPVLSGSCHISLAALANKYGPIFTLRLGIHSVLVVTSSELTNQIFTANDVNVTFRPSLVAAKLMGYNYAFFSFTPGGPFWREMRKISAVQLLSNRRLELLKHIRVQEVETSVKELYQMTKRTDRKIVEIKRWLSDLNMNVLLRMIIGKKFFGDGAAGDEQEGRRFQKGITILFYYLGTLVVRDAVPFLGWVDFGGHEKIMKKTAKELDKILGKWLEEHKKKRNLVKVIDKEDNDFMHAMISILDGKKIEDYDVDTINKATSLSLIAGNETVTVALTWALSLLLNNQHVLKKAQDELDMHVSKERLVNENDVSKLVYLQAIVKETLRLYPPAFIPGPRKFTEDCTIGGYHIPKNTWLMINLWKIQRDPNIWPDPLEFKPERFLTTHKHVDVRGQHFELFPFGAGRRACPAVSYGLQMLHLTLASLLHAFEIANPMNEPVDMTAGTGLTNMKLTPLEILVSPRLPPHCFE